MSAEIIAHGYCREGHGKADPPVEGHTSLVDFITSLEGAISWEGRQDLTKFPYTEGWEAPTLVITFDPAYDPTSLEKAIMEWSYNNVPSMYHGMVVLKFKPREKAK